MKDEKKIQLTTNDIQNLIQIVGTHPTPEGIGSPAGQEKARLVNLLISMRDQDTKNL